MRPVFSESSATAAKKHDRIRAVTPHEINARIDKDTEMRVWWHAARTRDELSRRMRELDDELPVERMLSDNSSLLALTGSVIGGSSPGGRDVLQALRRVGVRTQSEIDAERHALTVLDGYFTEVAADATSAAASASATPA